MKSNNKKEKEIYRQFYKEKVISGIKDANLEIKFIKSYLWVIPLLIIVFNFGMLQILPKSEKIIAYTIVIMGAILSVIGFLSQCCKLYFDNNNLILINKLNKKIVIDISRYPRIYIRNRIYRGYDSDTGYYETTYEYLHIEQNDKEIVLDIVKVGRDKIKLLLNNIETKERQEVTTSQWQNSSTEKEKTFSNYIEFLNKQEKIIGVKDTSQKIKLNNNVEEKKRLKICTILVMIAFALDCLLNFIFQIKNTSILKNFFMTVGVFLSIFDFYFLIMVIEKGKDNFLKISYNSNGSIRINKYLLDYKKNNIMINIRATLASTTNEKYNYELIIQGEKKSYTIELAMQHEKSIGELIDNLIFEPKK